jgi:tetratricopeptide (TPR) repeat protein
MGDIEDRDTLPRPAPPPADPPTPTEPGLPEQREPAIEELGGLQPGQQVGDRYRIVRRLGRGGMGEVYEAEDGELGERVALKVLRPDVAQRPGAADRFRREIQVARRVTHPNVCRIFDLGLHRRGDGSELPFFTMELLPGETLAQLLRRRGRLSEGEALPIAEQMVAGLAAAHAAGIVHRDFKSANVMIVPAEGSRPQRAVVSDFGLARELEKESTTQSASVLGTPDYMAPEQVEGQDVGPPADIYALGVVLYEMVCGVRPFSSESPLQTAVRRLSETPSSPRRHVPDLQPAWERTILRCLARLPERRFAEVGEVARALRGEPLRNRRVLWRRVAAGLLAVALLAGLALLLPRGHLRAPRPSAETPRRSLAVLGFRDLAGRPRTAWLATALAEMMTTELSAGDALRTIPGETVARARLGRDLPATDTLAADSLAQVRTGLGADLVVLGSYAVTEQPGSDRLRIDVRLQDVQGGEVIAALTESGNEEQLFELVSRAGSRLREKLGLSPRSAEEAAQARASVPADAEAARLYAEGLAQLRVFDALSARDLLERSVAREPGFPLSHAALAAAWSALGHDLKAREAAQRAFQLSQELPRRERLAVEARFRQASRERDRALELWSALCEFYPDDLDYGLQLAAAQSEAGRGKDALATVATLRKLHRPLADDPRIDLAESNAAEALTDAKHSLAAAQAARTKGEAAGLGVLVAQARYQECRAEWRLGDPERALSTCEATRRAFEAIGDRVGMGRASNVIGNVQWQKGELERARATYLGVLEVFRSAGNRAGEATALNNMAGTYLHQGRIEEAGQHYEQALAVAREIGDRRTQALALNNLALVAQQRGRLDAALARYEEALALSREMGEKQGIAMRLNNLGNLFRMRGEPEEARRRWEESLAITRELGEKEGIGFNLNALGELALDRADFATARKHLEAAVAVRTELAAKGWIGSSRMSLAGVDLEEGQPARAEPALREVIVEFREVGRPEDEAVAHALLSRALLDLGRHDEAVAEARLARSQAAKLEKKESRLLALATAAQVLARAGQPAGLIPELEKALLEAQADSLRDSELLLSCRLGELELLAGREAAGRARLQSVIQQARTRGSELIARQAQALLAPR